MQLRADPDPELLLAHSAWIRSLARRMAGAEAEDLVQETWLAALERPRSGVRSLRAWLAGVATNLARQTRRGEARRRIREQRSAGGATSEPSVAETFEAASTGRELADLVLALEEPFRTVVLLRFYEDLPPRRIAQRLGTPVRTVNSRLTRGIERLRERWQQRERAAGRDGEAGMRSLLLLVGPASASPAVAGASGAAFSLGFVLMNAKIWIGAAVLGTGAVALWLSSPRAPDTGAGEAALAADAEPAPAGSPLERPELAPGASERRAAAAPTAAEPAEPAGTAAATRRLRGRVLDAEARPLAGVEVGYSAWYGGEAGTGRASATSGALGVFEIEVSRGSGELSALDPAYVTVMSGRVHERTAVEPLIVVAPRLELGGRVGDQLGSPLGEVTVRYEHPRGFGARFEAVLDATEGGEWKTKSDVRGRFELAGVPSIAGAQLVAELAGFETWRGEVPWTSDRDLALTLVRSTAAVPAVAGRVVDPEHRPVAGAWVSLGSRSTATDAAGEFRLEREDALDASELRALKVGYRLARLAASAGPTGEPVWPDYAVLVLGGAPLAMAGRVLDARGEPRAGMRVWLADPTPFGVLMDDMLASAEYYLADAADEGWSGDAYWSSRDTDATGRFRLEGLLEREYSLRILDPRTLATRTAGPFRAGDQAVEIVFEDGELGRVAGRVTAGDGRPLAGVAVRILGSAFGGVWSDAGTSVSDAEGRFAFERIGGETLMLAVSGDDVVPHWTPVAMKGGGTTEVVLTVEIRRSFQVDLGSQPGRADALRVLDGDGAAVSLYRIGPTGSYHTEQFPLVDGRSESLGVGDGARTLVLLKGGTEVLRVPLALRPGKLNLVTP
jgi:RNA polymerase sigma-70 factor (ECF subfamily)